jgi:hypothetical protein
VIPNKILSGAVTLQEAEFIETPGSADSLFLAINFSVCRLSWRVLRPPLWTIPKPSQTLHSSTVATDGADDREVYLSASSSASSSTCTRWLHRTKINGGNCFLCVYNQTWVLMMDRAVQRSGKQLQAAITDSHSAFSDVNQHLAE